MTRPAAYNDDTPLRYARSIAYLGCPVKIAKRTELYFGRSPSRPEIEKLLANRAPRRLELVADEELAFPQPPEPVPPLRIVFSETHPLNLSIPSELAQAIAKAFGMTVEAAFGPSRHSEHVAVRSVMAKLLRERGLSLPQVARHVRRKDHSTIIHYLHTYDYRARRFPEMHDVYNEMKARGA